jgi:hypothetical protein
MRRVFAKSRERDSRELSHGPDRVVIARADVSHVPVTFRRRERCFQLRENVVPGTRRGKTIVLGRPLITRTNSLPMP